MFVFCLIAAMGNDGLDNRLKGASNFVRHLEAETKVGFF